MTTKYATGNRCGHNPERPNLSMAPKVRLRDKTPPVLKYFIERVDIFYWKPAKTFPTLNAIKAVRLAIRYGDLSLLNMRFRRMRSERREACVRLLKAVCLCTDLTSMRVGEPTPDGFVNKSMYELAAIAGLDFSRACRAATDLRDADMVTVDRICEQDGDQYAGHPAVRQLKPQVFDLLGLGQILAKARAYATEKLQKKAKDVGRSLIHFTRTLIKRKSNRSQIRQRKAAEQSSQTEIATNKARAAALLALSEASNNLSPNEILQRLKQLL